MAPNGVITSVAGGSYCSFYGDNGPATQAFLCSPHAVSVDSLGRVLVADTGNYRIRRFLPGGLITTIAGTVLGTNIDSGLATTVPLSSPIGVTSDSQGTIYVADSGHNKIRAIAADGTLSTIAGNTSGTAGFAGDGSAASNALVNNPLGIVADSHGNLYIADSANSRVRVINASRSINTLAGTGHYTGDNGPALAATMTNPSFVTYDKSGNLYIADQDDHVIRKVDTDGKITTIAGTGIAGAAGDGGAATSAQLSLPQGLVFDNAGNLYVADSGNHSVRMIAPSGAIVRFAGGGTVLGDGGPALKATLNTPHGLALDSSGSLYIADTNNNRIRKILPDGSIVTIIGNSNSYDSGDGGLAASAGAGHPFDVKVASDGTIYFSESGGYLRVISPNGIVTTNSYYYGGSTNPGVALDASGTLFSSAGNQIYVQAASNRVAIAGQTQSGFGGDGGPALLALLNNALGMTIDSKGNVVFSDQHNNRIRKLTADPVTQLVAISGDKQSGVVGTALPLPLLVQVNGANGLPFPGITVTYAVPSVNGRLSTNQTVTGTDGRAAVSVTPLLAGPVTVTATVAGLTPITFTVTGIDPPGSIAVLSGNNQFGATGSTLPQVIAVSVLNSSRRPLTGVPVTFAVAGGKASLNPSTTTTGADGAAYTVVTLGDTAGPVTISATVTGLPPAVFTLTATSADSPQIFNAGVVSAGLSTPAIQAVAPNAIVSIFGKNFAPAGTLRKVGGEDLVNGRLPTSLVGVCVLFGTLRAPIFLVSPGQLNVQVPLTTSVSPVSVQVLVNCDSDAQIATNAISVAVQSAVPEFFYASGGTAKNPVAATDAQAGAGIGDPARLGSGFAPAYPGEVITLYATGFGLSSPAFAAGQLPPGGAPVNNVLVNIDGQYLDASAIQYAGVAPQNAGLYQLNVALPATLTSGDHVIVVSVTGHFSPNAILTVSADTSHLRSAR